MLLNIHIAVQIISGLYECAQHSHAALHAGAKYPLKAVKAAMQEAQKGGSQGKVLLEG